MACRIGLVSGSVTKLASLAIDRCCSFIRLYTLVVAVVQPPEPKSDQNLVPLTTEMFVLQHIISCYVGELHV